MKKTDVARELIQIELIYKAKQLLKEHKQQQLKKNKILKENYQNYLLSEINLLESTATSGTVTLTQNNITINIKNKNVDELIAECTSQNTKDEDLNTFIDNLEKIKKTGWGDSRVALKKILEILSENQNLNDQLTIDNIQNINTNVEKNLFKPKETNSELVEHLNNNLQNNTIYQQLYSLLPTDSGPWGTPGKGEILICLVLDDAKSGGSKSNDIIRNNNNNNFIEVKTYKTSQNNVAIPSKAFVNKSATDINLKTIIPTMQDCFRSISNILKRFSVSMQLKLKDEGDKLCNYTLSKTLDNSYSFDIGQAEYIKQKMIDSGLTMSSVPEDVAKLTKIKYFLLEPNSITAKQSTIQMNSTLCIKSLCLLFVENGKVNNYIAPYNELDNELFNVDAGKLNVYLSNNYTDNKSLKKKQMQAVTDKINTNLSNGNPEQDFGDISSVLDIICYFSKYYKWKLDTSGITNCATAFKSLITNSNKIGEKDFKAQLDVDKFIKKFNPNSKETKINLANKLDSNTGFASRSQGKAGEDPIADVFGKYNYFKNEGKIFPLLVSSNDSNGVTYTIAEEDVSLYQSVKSFVDYMPNDAFKNNDKTLLEIFLKKMQDYDNKQKSINNNPYRFNPTGNQKLINLLQPFIDIYNEFYFTEDNDPLSEKFSYKLDLGSFSYVDFDKLNTLIDYSIDKTTVLSKNTEITIETKQNKYYLYTDLDNINIKDTNGLDTNISDITDTPNSFKSLSIVNSDPGKDALESGKDAKKQYNSNKHNKYFGVNENRIKNHLNQIKLLKENATNQNFFINNHEQIKELEYLPILENLIKAILYLENAIINYYHEKFIVFEELSETNITCCLLDKKTIKTEILTKLIGITTAFKGLDPVVNPLYLKTPPQITERSTYVKNFFDRYVDFKSMLVFYKITKKDANGNVIQYTYKNMSDNKDNNNKLSSNNGTLPTLDEIKAAIKEDVTAYFENYINSLPQQ